MATARVDSSWTGGFAVLFALLFFAATSLYAEPEGRLSGTVSLKETGSPLHGASISIVELGRSALTQDDGSYNFERVPAGRYRLIAHLDSFFTEATQVIQLSVGETRTVDFTLSLSESRYDVTVTASEKEETTFESFQSVDSYAAHVLVESTDVSLGEALDLQVGTGIAKRSFGPGSSRPIIRGFDGDRVLVMEDGIRTGTLSSQSGDHGELINPAQLERLEIVKGPATLLYSGSAMGGTVNAVSRHHALHQHAHQGLRGFASGSVGTTNALAGSSVGFEYGHGRWMLWAQGGGIRSGDYGSPEGEIFNSRSRIGNGGGGFGWFGERIFFSVDGKYDDGLYGVPFAQDLVGHEEGEGQDAEDLERVALDSRRSSYRFDWGLNDLGSTLESFTLKLGYTDWEHEEIEFFSSSVPEIGTTFANGQFVFRGTFEQRRKGLLSGRFGFWGIDRDYDVAGAEALSPPVDQSGLAAFVLQEAHFERVKFQFGGRLERQQYDPVVSEQDQGAEGRVAAAVNRTFLGASAAAGVHAGLWSGGALVANYSHSYRAPALEELYNFGPHLGNLAFEIGDAALEAETGDGLDVSLRNQHGRVRGEVNLFYYNFSNFVFPLATGEEENGLRVIAFTQREARFMGAEATASLGIQQNLWLNLGIDFVDAQETSANTPLPRIPPLRGRLGFDYGKGNFRFAPELILASQQHQTFTGEARTPGYSVVNLKGSYTYAQQHLAHQFSINVFNLGDRLYRNHSSFIKDLAPEIGRGVRFTYMVRFF